MKELFKTNNLETMEQEHLGQGYNSDCRLPTQTYKYRPRAMSFSLGVLPKAPPMSMGDNSAGANEPIFPSFHSEA